MQGWGTLVVAVSKETRLGGRPREESRLPGSEVKDAAVSAQLRRNSLGLPELIFHGITHIAPATNVIFTFPIIAMKAGPAMPIPRRARTQAVRVRTTMRTLGMLLLLAGCWWLSRDAQVERD